MNRKKCIKNSTLAAVSFSLFPPKYFFTAGNILQKVKLAIIGVGARGSDHLDMLLRRDDVELVAICDVDDRVLKTTKDAIDKAGKKMLKIYTGDNYAWQKLLQQEKLQQLTVPAPL